MAEFVGHEPCPDCSSSDALSRYDDGSAHCFSCKHNIKPDAGYEPSQAAPKKRRDLLTGAYCALGSRKITEETAKKFGYSVGSMSGTPVQIAPYRNSDGVIVAQKTRTKDKRFVWTGDAKAATQLFGQHLWSDKGRRVVVTEGEIDCLTVSQLNGNKWPVVSVPNGSSGSVKAIRENISWLEGYDEVVFMFDGDPAGRDGAHELAAELSPGRAKIANLPEGYDPNRMLVDGKGAQVIDAIWQAKPFRPDNIKSLSDLKEAVLTPPERGIAWPWHFLTEITYGIRRGEVYVYGAGVGIGKTTAFLQIAEYMVTQHNLPVGLFYYEQPVVETAKRLAGMHAGKQFHIPNPEEGEPNWTEEELMTAFDALEDKVFLYDHFGSISWEETKKHIRYLAKANNVKDFFVDHLTALIAHEGDERRALDALMAEVASLAQELQITVHLISHLTTADGTAHEEGGRVLEKQFTGSRAIARWAHFMFGYERDKQAEDETIRHTTTMRVLKDRFTGQASGQIFFLKYDVLTGKLVETTNPFKDETEGGGDFSGNPDF